MRGFEGWKRRREMINARGLGEIFVTLQTELEGLIYRLKGGEKGKKWGGKRIQVSPQNAAPPDTKSVGKQNVYLNCTSGGDHGRLALPMAGRPRVKRLNED